MPLPKLVDRINWVNDTDPAINDTHLNQMDSELDAIDDRVISMEGDVEAQAEEAEAWAVGERGGTPVDPTDPTYENNSKHYAGEAASSASDAAADALKSEGFAVGEQGGIPVSPGSPYYENNAKHYAGEAADSASDASTEAAAAAGSAEDAEAWSEGTRGGVPVGPGDPAYQHNAHYWEQQAQGAIAGVTSFTGAQGTQRSGPVTAQSGDYDDGMITVDRTGTSLPASVNDLHDVLELLYPQGVSVTLTLNGAKNDVITIKDSNDSTVGTCTFTSGQTSGTVSITVPNGGGSFKFISSVAKDTTTGTSDYEKTVTLSDAVSQTVNVYPKNALYWFGNNIGNMRNGTWSGETLINVTEDTNNLKFSASGAGYKYIWFCSDVLDLSRYSSVKLILSGSNAQADACGLLHAPTREMASTTTLISLNSYSHATEVKSQTLSKTSGCIGFKFQMEPNNTLDINGYALVFDDGHESDITIHGAKEDTITITDSNNQTVATCVFGSGSTVGYVSKSLLPSGTYTFTSSVAKMKSGGSFVDYAKTVVLDGSETEIDVFPDEVMYWFGNEKENITALTSGGGTFTKSTNNISLSIGEASFASIQTAIESGKTLKAIVELTNIYPGGEGFGLGYDASNSVGALWSTTFPQGKATSQHSQDVQIGLAEIDYLIADTGTYYVKCGITYYTTTAGKIHAIWVD